MSISNHRIVVPDNLPFILVRDGVVFPGVTLKIPCRAAQNIAVIEQRLMNDVSIRNSLIGIAFQKFSPSTNEINPKLQVESNSSSSSSAEDVVGFHEIGVAAIVTQVAGTNWPRPSYTIQVTGVCRIRIGRIISSQPFMYAAVSQVDKFLGVTPKLANIAMEKFLDNVVQLFEYLPRSDNSVLRLKKVITTAPIDYILDLVGAIVENSYEERLSILSAIDLDERLKVVDGFVRRQLEKYKHSNDNGNGKFTVEMFPESVKVDDITKALISGLINNRGSIRNGIGGIGNQNRDGDSKSEDAENLEAKIREAKMPMDVEKVALDELRKMKMASQHEHPLIRQYLELLVDLPWNMESTDTLDLQKARSDLDEDHYGLESVKKRILEYLAVKRMQNSLKGPILCFVGPPGVGKTSIARSIARTLGRKFYRISLGGISDQTDIRGFNRTYVASMPGRIINGMKAVRTNNPVFLLDEVDKIHSGARGDPAAALLEVLDPEQNFQFLDHYLNVPFDLSKVLFVATANSASDIPGALADRMEMITIAGYTAEEKLSIAQKYLVPKQLKEHGLNEGHVTIPDESLRTIVHRYTREAGVRSFERKLGAIMRAVALKAAENLGEKTTLTTLAADSMDVARAQRMNEFPIVIDEQAVEDILGLPLHGFEAAEQLSTPGVAAGLAWTPFGGEIMYVEATKMDGEGKLTLTGQLGDVMKESARVALNWLRSHSSQLGISIPRGADLLEKTDIHIHFPSGAVGKDGPSAGITVLVALVSLFTGRCVRSDTALTGEITLRGLILPVGGIKEKLLAAHRAGFTRVILPKRNSRDVNTDMKKSMDAIPVETMEAAIDAAFDGGFPALKLAVISSKL